MSTELTKTQIKLADSFKPHFSVLSKPKKHTWAEISKAWKFADKHGLGNVHVNSKDIEFTFFADPNSLAIASAVGKRKPKLAKTEKKAAKADKKVAKAEKKALKPAKKAKKAKK